MSKVQVDKVVNLSDDGAPQLTYGAELPVGYGLTGAGGLNITGVVTAASAVFSGNVTIGGTLTYEDVTNIDVVGVSTFAGRMNVNSSLLANEGIKVVGVSTLAAVTGTTGTFSGAVSGTTGTFSGAVSGTTGTFSGDVDIADKIVHTGDTNTALRFPSADTVSVETGGSEALRIDSSQRVVIGATSQRTVWGGQQKVSIEGTDGPSSSAHIVRNSNDASYPYLALGKSRGTSDGSSTIVQDDDVTGIISFNGADGGDMNPQTAYIESAVDGTPGTNDMPGRLTFHTTADGAYNSTERLRIDSSGRIGIKTNNPQVLLDIVDSAVTNSDRNGDDKITVENNGTTNINLISAANNSGFLLFSDDTRAQGYVKYDHSLDDLCLSASDDVWVRTNGSERLRIAADGEVFIGDGIGTADRNTVLSVSGSNQDPGAVWTTMGIYSSDSYAQNKGGSLGFGGQDGSVTKQQFAAISGVKENGTSGNYAGMMRFWTRPAGGVSLERMKILSTGVVQIMSELLAIGASTNEGGASSGMFGIEYAGNAKNAMKMRNTYSGNGNAMVMITGSTEVGSIVQNTSSTSYNTSSDYRLKENAVGITSAITRLKTLKPYRFNWKSDSSTTVDGFFAHEVTAVPEAIKGTKDAVASEDIDSLNIKKDDPIYQQIDQSKLVPLLTAALQEAVEETESLKTLIKNSSSFAALKSSL